MRILPITGFVFLIIGLWSPAPGLAWQEADTDTSHEEVRLPELRAELLEREEKDQAARKALIPEGEEPQQGMAIDPALVAELMKVDKENREWLKEQIAEHGWLGKSLVGTDGASAAWLLVQHADMDRAFQKECLELMTAAGPEEVASKNVAYLTDRVLVAEGKPQRYGTQASMVDGKLQLQECEDPDNLNARRAEVGLGSIEEYLQVMRDAYNLPDEEDGDNKDNDK